MQTTLTKQFSSPMLGQRRFSKNNPSIDGFSPIAIFRSREPREVSPSALPPAGRRSSKTLPRGFSLSQVSAESWASSTIWLFCSRQSPRVETQCMGYMGIFSTSGTTIATPQSWVEHVKRSTDRTQSLTQSRTEFQPSTAASPWSLSALGRLTFPPGRSSLEVRATQPHPPIPARSMRRQASVETLPSFPTDLLLWLQLERPHGTHRQLQEVWDVVFPVASQWGLAAARLSRRLARGRWRRLWGVAGTSSGGKEQPKPGPTIATPTLSSGTTGFRREHDSSTARPVCVCSSYRLQAVICICCDTELTN